MDTMLLQKYSRSIGSPSDWPGHSDIVGMGNDARPGVDEDEKDEEDEEEEEEEEEEEDFKSKTRLGSYFNW